ncbi:MAG: PaaI family thioesterase [Pseudomonadota bacterium]
MIALLADIDAVLRGEKTAHVITSIPYATFLGLRICKDVDGALAVEMPYKEALIGSPRPPRIHGGTIGALLEFAGTIAVARAARDDTDQALGTLPKPIGITIEYMRGGAPEDIMASAQVLRLGRRIANVRATAWQERKDKPNATATMHFLMPG